MPQGPLRQDAEGSYMDVFTRVPKAWLLAPT